MARASLVLGLLWCTTLSAWAGPMTVDDEIRTLEHRLLWAVLEGDDARASALSANPEGSLGVYVQPSPDGPVAVNSSGLFFLGEPTPPRRLEGEPPKVDVGPIHWVGDSIAIVEASVEHHDVRVKRCDVWVGDADGFRLAFTATDTAGAVRQREGSAPATDCETAATNVVLRAYDALFASDWLIYADCHETPAVVILTGTYGTFGYYVSRSAFLTSEGPEVEALRRPYRDADIQLNVERCAVIAPELTLLVMAPEFALPNGAVDTTGGRCAMLCGKLPTGQWVIYGEIGNTAPLGIVSPVSGGEDETEQPEDVNMVTAASGLQYEDIVEGTGDSPDETDTVVVHYRGWLEGGSPDDPFDSSYDRGEPATFPLNRVIAGWTEGLQGMKEGGKRKLVIPPDLGYGERGAGSVIPPNATFVFEVELIEVK